MGPGSQNSTPCNRRGAISASILGWLSCRSWLWRGQNGEWTPACQDVVSQLVPEGMLDQQMVLSFLFFFFSTRYRILQAHWWLRLLLAPHCMVNQWFKNCIGWKPIFCLHLSLTALKWSSDTLNVDVQSIVPSITHHHRAGQLPRGVLASFSGPQVQPVFILKRGGPIAAACTRN